MDMKNSELNIVCCRCVNDCLKVSEDDSDQADVGAAVTDKSDKDRGVRLATPPSDKLVTITTNMNTNLASLLSILQEQEEEKQRLRRELTASQEQVRAFATRDPRDSDSHSFRYNNTVCSKNMSPFLSNSNKLGHFLAHS